MRRASPTRRRGPASPKGSGGQYCQALIRIDGSEIRRKTKKEYEKASRDLEKGRSELDRFQKEDLPQFTRWLNRCFGALLTELRETARRIDECRELILEIEFEALSSGASHARAYARVKQRREDPESGEANDDPFGPRPDFDDKGGFEESFNEGFAGYSPWEQEKEKPKTPPGSRLKELYRALVRRLHPDGQEDYTSQKEEWWHKVQEAYESGNEEEMELILSLCEIEETGTTEKTSLSLLQRITKQLKRSLLQIKRQLTVFRRDPAWNFSARRDRESLAVELRCKLEAQLRTLRQEQEEMEQLLRYWEYQAVRRPRRRTARKPQNATRESFF